MPAVAGNHPSASLSNRTFVIVRPLSGPLVHLARLYSFPYSAIAPGILILPSNSGHAAK